MRKSVIAWMATVAVLLMSAGLTGCHHDNDLIGDWDPMEWKTDVQMKNYRVTVPPQGGTYKFTCTNYDGFWLSDIEEEIFDKDTNRLIVTYFRPNVEDGDYRYIKGEWVEVSVQGNVMTVVVAANETDKIRSANVVPTAGDIFAHFYFYQPVE